jgi:hypothetical protein
MRSDRSIGAIALALLFAGCNASVCTRHSDCAPGLICSSFGQCRPPPDLVMLPDLLTPPDLRPAPADLSTNGDGGVADDGGTDGTDDGGAGDDAAVTDDAGF